jgi:thymidylate kinase
MRHPSGGAGARATAKGAELLDAEPPETPIGGVKCETVARSSAHSSILHLLAVVLADFHRQNVSYCYWKSSRRLHAALAGETDLDLLVARGDRHRAQRILLERGLKLFPSVAHRDDPAMSSYLGYDEPSGRIVHFHLHFLLVAGHSLLKNYRLPWEETILARAVAHPMLPIRILDPASEALLLMVRACLELRRSDPVTLRNWQATRRKFALDRAELAARVDRGTFRNRAAEAVGEDVADMLATAFGGDHALGRQRRLRRLEKELAAFRTYSAVEARLRGAWRAMLWMVGGLNERWLDLPRPWSRRAPGGGCVVALLGVDGSGKTTVVGAIRTWLGAEVDVVPTYFGTGAGRPSLLLLPFKLMVPMITPWLRTKPRGISQGKVSTHAPGLLYSLLLMVWATVVALEKRSKLLAAHRGAKRGLIVVADRYPHNEILDFNDGPLLARLSKAPRWLRRFEVGAYALARRLPPDLVIKLRVTPETAARREPDMDPAVIPERIDALQRLTFPGARVVSVDAERPLEEVIRSVKREIWSLL